MFLNPLDSKAGTHDRSDHRGSPAGRACSGAPALFYLFLLLLYFWMEEGTAAGGSAGTSGWQPVAIFLMLSMRMLL